MPLLTTVVGSYPASPSNERMADSFFTHDDPFKESIKTAIKDQMDAGIDMISDGQTRSDMIELFAQGLRGYRIKEKVEIVAEVEYVGPITVDDQRYVKELIPEDIGLKGIITGPWTMVNGSTDLYYDDPKEAAFDTAIALKQEAELLAEICDIVQVDEPFLSVNFPDYAVELIDTVTDIKTTTALHVCGDVSDIAGSLINTKVDILDHEFAANPALYDVYSDLSFTQRMAVGIVSTKPKTEKPEVVKERIRKAIDLFGENIMLDPDCGLRNIERWEAQDKLKRMVEARDVIAHERSG